ncbi:reverse transcriptase domain-containing protein [Tanacetum coccineum]|uniref:Reverse transcriptase domain-containing protein n=1 Tax=Tanacetum coccineum TaxID=301880 RepID=A0ABQ5DDH0_9ASTR
MKLTDKRPAETDIRLSLASHSYIYPLGIAKDVLVEVVEHVYPVDFVILDIKEDEKRSFILGTPFLTTAKAVIKFDKGTITLRSGKSKISFHRIPESLCKIERGVKNDIEPIAPTMTVNRLVLEWEERIKLHLERKMEFDQWKSKNFKGKHPALVKVEGGMDDEGEVTKFLIKNEEEIFTDAGDGVRIYPDGVASLTITWMAFGGNTRDLGSFGEETDEITDLHQILEEVLLTERGDGVASIKRRRRDLFSDGVWNLETASGRFRKPAFVCIAVDTSREMRVRRKDTIRLFEASVNSDEVEAVASSLNCSHDYITFMYLGLPVGKKIPHRGRAFDDLDSLISVIGNLSFTEGSDKWVWRRDASRFFKVSSLSASIQNKLLADSLIGHHHLWNLGSQEK